MAATGEPPRREQGEKGPADGDGGEQLTCRLYILVKGKHEYDLTTQAVSADWDSLKGTLEDTVQTFTLD